MYIVPKRLNQDFVEAFFSEQQQMCGGSRNMTAYTYGYNVLGTITYRSSKLVSRKQTNVYAMEECMELGDNSSQLPKREKSRGIFDTIQWTVEI